MTPQEELNSLLHIDRPQRAQQDRIDELERIVQRQRPEQENVTPRQAGSYKIEARINGQAVKSDGSISDMIKQGMKEALRRR
ncbi:MAG: hypothetical protein KJ630_19235 [Proteobacteria bacterium]|nr:hypothetical protein [Pseudomonadota bacterium]